MLKLILPFGFLFSMVFGVGLVSFVSGRYEKSPARDAFTIQVILGSIWLLCTFFMLTASTPEAATIFSRLAYLGAIFLSVSACHLVICFLDLKHLLKFIKLGYIVGLVAFVPLLLTDLLLEPVYQYSWGYWYHAGKLHGFFSLYLSTYGIMGLIILIRQLMLTKEQIHRQKIRLILIGYIMSFFMLIDMFAHHGNPVLPVGFIFIDIYLFIMWFIIKFYDFFSMWRRIIQ